MTSDSPGGGRRRGASSSGLNPGVSAAGSAAKRTALDPSAGPAAIGGMLSLRSSAVPPVPTASPAQSRLTTAVTDITKLANAMEVLSIVRREDAP
jgi:hypothetical protein